MLVSTAEQDAIRVAFTTGDDIIVTALAGSGKTSTLRMLAHDQLSTFMTYCCFNSSVASDARRRFPANVTCRTMHSFAYSAIGKQFEKRLNGPHVPTWRVADILGTPEYWSFGDRSLRSRQLARLALDALRQFCLSADEQPLAEHVPPVVGMEAPEAHAALSAMLLPFVRLAWDDVTSRRGQLYYQHDFYLKLWGQGNPQLPGEVILVDEAQDLDPLIAYIISRQSAQRVYVGDSHQQIYEWRKAVNVLDSLGDLRRFPLTKSFRFNVAIAGEANRILTLLQADLRVVGNDAVSSVLAVCPSPDVILTRTNAEAIAQLMEAQVDGLKAGLVGGTVRVEALALAAQQLKAGKRTDHPELMAFETWEQVQEHVEDADEARELQVLVKLVDKHGPDVLLEAVRAAVPEDQADLVLSTVHKVKGREWSRVKIAPDFPVPITDSRETGKRELRVEEARLAYVAVTRAQNVLDSRELAWVGALADRLGQERIFEELPFGAMV